MEKCDKNRAGGATTTPLISVIIPVYNVAPYLWEALDSVVNQTYNSLQILVIDDGSTDDSSQICDEYSSRDPRITVVHQKNGGLSNARNTGLDLATGDYIAFLDSDDAWHPSFVEELLSAIADVDIALCRFIVQKTEERLGKSGSDKGVSIAQPEVKAGTYGRKDCLRMLVNDEINWTVWNKLYRAELWKTIRFPDGQNFEDVEAMYQIIDISTSITMIDKVLYFNRTRSGSITHMVSWKNIEDHKISSFRLEEFVRSHVPEIFTEKDVLSVRTSRLVLMLIYYVSASSGSGDMGKAQREALRKEIVAAGQEIGNCAIRYRIVFFMVKHCPWLLNTAYSVYRPLHLLFLKVTGK